METKCMNKNEDGSKSCKILTKRLGSSVKYPDIITIIENDEKNMNNTVKTTKTHKE